MTIRLTALTTTMFALALALCAAPGRCGEAPVPREAPDFAPGREVAPDFNLEFEVPAAKGELLVAVGGEKGWAFVLFTPGAVSLGSFAADGKAPFSLQGLPALKSDERSGLVLKFRGGAGRHLALVAGRRELGRVALPELDGPFRLAFAGGGQVKVAGIQKIDRSERVLFSDDFTRQGEGLGDWEASPRSGAWRILADPRPETSASPFAMECAGGGRPALAAVGQSFWDDYLVRAAASIQESPAAAGLAFNLAADGSGYLLRLVVEGGGSGGAGRAELVRLAAGGREEVLAASPLRGAPLCWYELELASVAGELRAAVDGNELAKLSGRTDLVGGRIGLWSSGLAAVRFDDVRVEALSLSPADFAADGAALDLARRRWWLPPPSLPDYFANDRTMQSWARLGDEWAAADGGWWFRARLAGDQEISWRAAGRFPTAGQLVLVLAAEGQSFAGGYRLVAEPGGAGGAGGAGALLQIFEGDRRAAGCLLPLGGAGVEQLSFSREAGRLVARVGSRVVLSAPDTLKLAGGRAGARALGGWRLERGQLAATGANLLDETFARAPVEWAAVTGGWEVASRWRCEPEFSWMLGRARKGLARLDLKRPVRGDLRLDLHFAVAMAERPAPFYDWPSNLTVALSPDPANPAAGYVFAFGGIDEPSRLIRAGRSVGDSASLVRNWRGSGDTGPLHSHWFSLRIERRGATLTFWGDGEKLAEFTDPEPLKDADHLAIWTRGDNGAALARIRLEAAGPLGPRRSPFAKDPLPGEDLTPNWSNRDGTAGARVSWMPGKGDVTLQNVNAGGTFAAAYKPPWMIDLAKTGWLSFGWNASAGARVNLYLVRGDAFYRVKLTGPATRVGGRYGIRHLGGIPGGRAGAPGVQEIGINLAAALAAAEPGLKDFRIDEIRIGNYEVEDVALFEGMTGNKAGEKVLLSGWELTEDPAGGKDPRLALEAPPAPRRPAPPRLVEPAPLEQDDFERDLGGWEPLGGVDGARMLRDPFRPPPGGGRWCLLGENLRCGGSLGALARSRPFDVRRYPVLTFDYCLDPGTFVNLLVLTSRGRNEVQLTNEYGGSELLGSVSGARADGKWRRAELDLGEMLSGRGPQIVKGLGLINLGGGSSTTTSAWRIDNWAILPAVDGSRPARFRWTAADGSPAAGWSAVLDRNPTTQPEERVTQDKPELEQPAGLAAGTWWLHVRGRDKAGNWSEPSHWRFKVTAGTAGGGKAPAVAAVRPAEGESACPSRVEVAFAEGSEICPHDLALTIGGRTWRPGDDGVGFYPAERRLTVDLAGFDGRLLVKPGKLSCAVEAADYAGNVMPRYEWTWELDPRKAATAPPAPRVVYLPSDRVLFEDFETGQSEFAEWRRGVAWRVAARLRGEAAGGRGYLVTVERRLHDNNNEVQLWPHAFDPERHSYLAFDYRLRRNASFNLMMEVNNQLKVLGFTQTYGHSVDILGLPEARNDGQWHRLEFDLRKLREKFPRGPGGRMATVQKLLARFDGRDGADLDNFVIGSPRGRDPEFVWEPPEVPGGVAGYSWMLDGAPDTTPPENISGQAPRTALHDIKPGTHWFHVRAVGAGGLWGETAHQRIVIEE